MVGLRVWFTKLVLVLSLIGNLKFLSLGETDALLGCVALAQDIEMVVDFGWVFWWPSICEVVSRVALADRGLRDLCDLICCLIWAGEGVLSMAFMLISSP